MTNEALERVVLVAEGITPVAPTATGDQGSPLANPFGHAVAFAISAKSSVKLVAPMLKNVCALETEETLIAATMAAREVRRELPHRWRKPAPASGLVGWWCDFMMMRGLRGLECVKRNRTIEKIQNLAEAAVWGTNRRVWAEVPFKSILALRT